MYTQMLPTMPRPLVPRHIRGCLPVSISQQHLLTCPPLRQDRCNINCRKGEEKERRSEKMLEESWPVR